MADDKTEAYELSRIGAEPTKNSGRGNFQKGDGIIRSDHLDENYPNGFITVDVKESKASFGLSLKAWAKLQRDMVQNKTPHSMFFVSLGEDEPKQRVVVISETLYHELWEVYKEHG